MLISGITVVGHGLRLVARLQPVRLIVARVGEQSYYALRDAVPVGRAATGMASECRHRARERPLVLGSPTEKRPSFVKSPVQRRVRCT
jgi:hypothetical protein